MCAIKNQRAPKSQQVMSPTHASASKNQSVVSYAFLAQETKELYNFRKLDENNYGVWRTKMQLVLEDLKLWDFVRYTKLEYAVHFDKKVDEEFQKKWEEKSREAAIKISLCLSDGQLLHVEDLKYGDEIWNKLASYHEPQNIKNQLSLQRDFFAMKLESDDIESHGNLVKEKANLLKRCGVKLEETTIIAVLLNSLPEEYDALVTALDVVGAKDLNFEEVRTKVVNMKKANTTPMNAFIGRRPVRFGKEEKKYKNEGRKCYFCNKVGHVKRDCRLMKKHTLSLMAVNGVAGKYDYSNWIVDSGASMHMCGSKEMLVNFIGCSDDESVLAADGKKMKVLGYGDVLLWLGDRKVNISNVALVSGLAHNLFSINQFIRKGNQVLFKGKQCMLKDGNGRELVTCWSTAGVFLFTANVVMPITMFARKIDINELHKN